jgi:hypothetical protein
MWRVPEHSDIGNGRQSAGMCNMRSASENFRSYGRAKPYDILVGVSIESALSDFLTAAFLTLLAHAVRAFLLCTSRRTLAGLYVALRETFHHRSRLPCGYPRSPILHR